MINSQLSDAATTMLRASRRNTRRIALNGILSVRNYERDRPAPDFVIAGAQRCGTTSLFRALAKHPGVMPNVINAKGVHYFDTNYQRNKAWYLAHFPTRNERARHAAAVGHKAVVGEASPYYLYHPAAAERMASVIPDTKIIVLLRNPTKRAISHHLHMVWEGHESVEDIDRALDLESIRLRGTEERLLSDPAYVSRHHQHHSYIARGHYAPQLKRLFRYFDRKNVLVMTTEQLISESQTSLARIQSFIGLEPDTTVSLEKNNASHKFDPRPETINRLNAEFLTSNEQLRSMLDIDISWN